MNNVMKRSMVFMIALIMALTAMVLTGEQIHAKAKPWYGRYWEFGKQAKKVVKIKGSKVYLKGKWEVKAKKYSDVKSKKIKKTFKLTKKTKYYLEFEDSSKPKKVSKKKFKKHLYYDVTYCNFYVKGGKVVKAYLTSN